MGATNNPTVATVVVRGGYYGRYVPGGRGSRASGLGRTLNTAVVAASGEQNVRSEPPGCSRSPPPRHSDAQSDRAQVTRHAAAPAI
jgi:hypothetical protein